MEHLGLGAVSARHRQPGLSLSLVQRDRTVTAASTSLGHEQRANRRAPPRATHSTHAKALEPSPAGLGALSPRIVTRSPASQRDVCTCAKLVKQDSALTVARPAAPA